MTQPLLRFGTRSGNPVSALLPAPLIFRANRGRVLGRGHVQYLEAGIKDPQALDEHVRFVQAVSAAIRSRLTDDTTS
jgi:hypothetical protein